MFVRQAVGCNARAKAEVLVAVLIALLGGLYPAIALAVPRLRCQLAQGGTTRILDFSPTMNPYLVKPVDINGRFRFKAVVLGDDRKIEYIKLYAYYQSDRQAVLLHEVKYVAPMAHSAPDPNALTGVNYVYSPSLGRELQFGCALFEVQP